jgi:hypothetical protein
MRGGHAAGALAGCCTYVMLPSATLVRYSVSNVGFVSVGRPACSTTLPAPPVNVCVGVGSPSSGPPMLTSSTSWTGFFTAARFNRTSVAAGRYLLTRALINAATSSLLAKQTTARVRWFPSASTTPLVTTYEGRGVPTNHGWPTTSLKLAR